MNDINVEVSDGARSILLGSFSGVESALNRKEKREGIDNYI